MKSLFREWSNEFRWSPGFVAVVVAILILPGGMLLLPLIRRRRPQAVNVTHAQGETATPEHTGIGLPAIPPPVNHRRAVSL